MLDRVVIPADIYHLILSHAYSTENEEIIGMLIGYWETVPNTNPYIEGTRTIAQVRHISFLTRSDKRKDRVEIAPESLHLAALQAEDYEKEVGSPMMVIGWYHSHPHITVFPSHVDLRTQLSQQMMDEKFFGIIVSCFDNNTENIEKVQITCFQSETDPYTNIPKKKNIPLMIQPLSAAKAASPTKKSETKESELDLRHKNRDLFLKLPAHMYEEYKKEFYASNQNIEYDLRSKRKSNTNSDSCDSTASAVRSLPDKMTELYNSGVYGQLVTSLVDNMVLPATHLLDLKALDLNKQIEELKALKQQLLSTRSPSTNESESSNHNSDNNSSSDKSSRLSSKPKTRLDDYLIVLE